MLKTAGQASFSFLEWIKQKKPFCFILFFPFFFTVNVYYSSERDVSLA